MNSNFINIKSFLRKKTSYALLANVLIIFSFLAFGALEPILVNAIEDQFTINQVISGEISFITTANDVVMNGTLAGITGGTSTGQTRVIVYTNNAAGYTMTITASSSPAMQGNSQGGTIADYTPAAAGIPDYTYSVPTSAEFGYTISASTTSDLAQKFLDNGSNTCNTGSADTSGIASCWYGLSTTATSTVIRNTSTPASGSTTTVAFQLKINTGSFIIEDTYTATTTLTVTGN